ncbi:hypothetical protein HMPREF3038_01549 [Akkermansia sp. KLE1797]|nr:hypothetical protein HMPREF3038_01549 [Akkermansia sp. KLE1797]KZA05522.1 hypothetical protein HMPREF1326_00697 [Akkermansia sp. KLE1605]
MPGKEWEGGICCPVAWAQTKRTAPVVRDGSQSSKVLNVTLP